MFRACVAACLALSTSAAAQDTAKSEPAYDAELSTYAYPYPVQRHTFESQGQRVSMAYMDVRPETPNGKAVVLMHGKNFAGAHWHRTIEALAAKGYRVVAPDQIGFGKSTKPEHFQFSFHALAAHTAALLDTLELPRVAVVGHSMGGMLATRFALLYPERTSRLVLVNPIGLEDWSRAVPYQPIDASFASELRSTPERVREYMRENYFAGEWKPAYDDLTRMQAGWLRGPDRRRIAWVSALASDMIGTQPVVHEFPDLRVPTLLIIGQRDRTAIGRDRARPDARARLGDYPVLGRLARDRIPGCELAEITEAGHLPQVEAFDRYFEALSTFLAR
jgi:pimeloyl-ACP methyl ester carboxylesterase